MGAKFTRPELIGVISIPLCVVYGCVQFLLELFSQHTLSMKLISYHYNPATSDAFHVLFHRDLVSGSLYVLEAVYTYRFMGWNTGDV